MAATHRSGTLLTKGPLLTATLVFGWPLVAGMAFHSLFGLVDLYIVGQLPESDVAIAAATIPSLINSIPMILYNGVVHYGVANMPGAVPRTSTYALTNATLPFARRLAKHGAAEAAKRDPQLRSAVNAWKGKVTHKGVSDAFSLPFHDVTTLT